MGRLIGIFSWLLGLQPPKTKVNIPVLGQPPTSAHSASRSHSRSFASWLGIALETVVPETPRGWARGLSPEEGNLREQCGPSPGVGAEEQASRAPSWLAIGGLQVRWLEEHSGFLASESQAEKHEGLSLAGSSFSSTVGLPASL